MFYFKTENYLIISSCDFSQYKDLNLTKISENIFDNLRATSKFRTLVSPELESVRKICSVKDLELIY